MAYDIYGCRLHPGNCEVHPHVHEIYPCSVCLDESRQHEAERQQYDKEMEQHRCDYDEEMRRQYETECAEAVVAFLRFATKNQED